jgi:hypothetical protein
MPRASTNTEKGSQHTARCAARASNLTSLLLHRSRSPQLTLRALAAADEHACSYFAARRAWKRFRLLRSTGSPPAVAATAAAFDGRGAHSRTFSAGDEAMLAQRVLLSDPPMTHTNLVNEALQLHRSLIGPGPSHHLRSRKEFRASSRWATGFKRRQRLSSHHVKLNKKKREGGGPREGGGEAGGRKAPLRDEEMEVMVYVNDVREAVDKYGEKLVLNMDETPVSLCDPPRMGLVRTGSNQPALVNTTYMQASFLTVFPTITAAGKKLQLCSILKGKTPRCLEKIKAGASAATSRVQLYYTERGKMNTGVMLLWLAQVVLPYTRDRPCALILDSYASHFADSVVALAARHNIQLIRVPPKTTATMQPLDVAFNGPFLAGRRKIWQDDRIANPFREDTWQHAVERSQRSYETISKEVTRAGFIKAYLIDENPNRIHH